MPSVKSLIRRRQFKKSIPSILILLFIVIIILSVYYVLSRQKQGQQEIQTCPECPQTLAPEERTPCPTNQDQRFSISNGLTAYYIIWTLLLTAFFVVGKFNKGTNTGAQNGGSSKNQGGTDQIKDEPYFRLFYGIVLFGFLGPFIWLMYSIREQKDLSAMIGITIILYYLLPPISLYL